MGDSEALWVVSPSGVRRAGGWIDDVLVQRVRERGMQDRFPMAGRFPRQRVEVVRGPDAVAEVNRLYYARGWADGQPVVPPTLGRLEAMMAASPLPGATVLGEVEPLRGLATVEKVAVNAIMAGCEPAYLPVVIAALQAMLEPAFNMRGVQTTDENVAPVLIVNGPIARRLQINDSFGCLGPGWQANAAIGRAVRLAMSNIGGGWAGVTSFAGLGQPARYSLCFAENEAQSPWPPLHVEAGQPVEASTVTVMRAESMINVTGGLAELASVMGSAASAFSLLHGGKVAAVVAPATAAALAAEGWSKQDVRRHLWQHGRIPVAEWQSLWVYRNVIREDRWPDWVQEAVASGAIPAVERPDDIVVVVAGGDVPIA
ncbi:MAG TPA: hypothetical protein VE631_01775, partial [Alphaproteobacteria bacterium]|nr:hypothetical protein [Alphaproteobacteria bacterium]